MSANLRLALPTVLVVLALFGTAPAQAQRPAPPATEADAVRMLASDDYRERDEAMYYVQGKVRDGEPVGAELRAAMLRATVDPGWGDGRPDIDPEANSDGWGELWSFYRDVVVSFRDPAMIPFMLAEGVGVYELASMGRPALLAMIETLEDPKADLGYTTVDAALAGLTLMVHDGLPTEDERARIGAATRYRLSGRLPRLPFVSAFGLAVTLDTPELRAMVERAANDPDVAATMRPEAVQRLQEEARKALEPGYLPTVIRWRRE